MSRQYAIELSKIELLGPKEKKVLQNWIKDQVSQKKIAFIGETTPLNSKNTQLKIIIETAKKSDDSVLNFSIVGYFLDAIENEQNDLLTNANSIHFKQYCKSNKCKFLCLMNCILFFFGVSSTCFIALASLTKQDKKILDIIPNNNSTDPVTSPLPDYSNNAAKEWILGFVGAMALLVDVILCCIFPIFVVLILHIMI